MVGGNNRSYSIAPVRPSQEQPREHQPCQASAPWFRCDRGKCSACSRKQWFFNCSRAPSAPALQSPEPVTLHVYDIGVLGRVLNKVLRPLDLGVFHVGIEVYNLEWSYSETPDPLTGTGVFVCRPAGCEGFFHVASLAMGTTAATEIEARRIIMGLEEKWSGDSYRSLSRNCCHFCAELLRMLGAGSMPEWVTTLASAADHLYRRKPHCCACPEDATDGNEVVDIVEPLPLYSSNHLEQEVEFMNGESIQWQPAPPAVPMREGRKGLPDRNLREQ